MGLQRTFEFCGARLFCRPDALRVTQPTVSKHFWDSDWILVDGVHSVICPSG